MLEVDNQATADDYTERCTLGPVADALSISYVVANAAVRAQLAPLLESGTLGQWGPELLLTPQTNVVQHVGGMRFRSAVAGTPARVVAQLFQPADPILGAGTSFSGTLTAAGGVVPVAADQPYFRIVRGNAAQAIPSGVSTPIQFDTSFGQSDQFWTAGVPDSIIVPASAGPGIYHLDAMVRLAGGGGTVREIIVTQIGTNQGLDIVEAMASGQYVRWSGFVTCSVGDVIKMLVFQDSGVPLNAQIGGSFGDIMLHGFKVHS